MKSRTRWILLVALVPVLSQGATFGAMQQAFSVKVQRIFSGQGATYVTFSSLPGCAGNGGYLSVSWPDANGGAGDESRTKQVVATLLLAKATDTPMEVRYRLNVAPTGWDSCAIDAVFLE